MYTSAHQCIAAVQPNLLLDIRLCFSIFSSIFLSFSVTVLFQMTKISPETFFGGFFDLYAAIITESTDFSMPICQQQGLKGKGERFFFQLFFSCRGEYTGLLYTYIIITIDIQYKSLVHNPIHGYGQSFLPSLFAELVLRVIMPLNNAVK